jgi:hypothetical protein
MKENTEKVLLDLYCCGTIKTTKRIKAKQI